MFDNLYIIGFLKHPIFFAASHFSVSSPVEKPSPDFQNLNSLAGYLKVFKETPSYPIKKNILYI
jgi:hypothetical protein